MKLIKVVAIIVVVFDKPTRVIVLQENNFDQSCSKGG